MKVIWTRFALNEVHSIHRYYKKHVSKVMADNIRRSLFGAVKQLIAEPYSGVKVEALNSTGVEYRSILRGYYRIIYQLSESELFITDVFDTRQDPEKSGRSKEVGQDD